MKHHRGDIHGQKMSQFIVGNKYYIWNITEVIFTARGCHSSLYLISTTFETSQRWYSRPEKPSNACKILFWFLVLHILAGLEYFTGSHRNTSQFTTFKPSTLTHLYIINTHFIIVWHDNWLRDIHWYLQHNFTLFIN